MRGAAIEWKGLPLGSVDRLGCHKSYEGEIYRLDYKFLDFEMLKSLNIIIWVKAP